MKKSKLKNNEKTLTHWLANWFMSRKTKRKNKDNRVQNENDECLTELGKKRTITSNMLTWKDWPMKWRTQHRNATKQLKKICSNSVIVKVPKADIYFLLPNSEKCFYCLYKTNSNKLQTKLHVNGLAQKEQF